MFISVCTARLNVYVPDDLAERARARGLNVSALTQAAISAELERSGTDEWLDTPVVGSTTARHDDVIDAIDAFYVELAHKAGLVLLTTDQRLPRAWPSADAIA
ncbi:MAG: type II toxin-antitoxin system CcdA family antitoxin [Actinomycetia bacterium]|nr:type II toxin-antitoxin system CcdA family antitoxin [Actinomycetes bacterium]